MLARCSGRDARSAEQGYDPPMRRVLHRLRSATSSSSAPFDPQPDATGQLDRAARKQWFRDHYETAAGEVEAFLGSTGVDLAGKEIADVGCGEGITDLGLVHRVRPRRLVGFDLNPVDPARLLLAAREARVCSELPNELEFVVSAPAALPAPDDAFDVVITWSAFEHVEQPVSLLDEIRRVLRPDGVLFLQLWPFYYSEQGSHLWHWFPEGYANLRYTEDEIARRLRSDEVTHPDWIEHRLVDNRTLNRITLDELHRSLLAAGFYVAKAELVTSSAHLTKELNRFPLGDLLVGGVKLVARPSW
jgi:ubiquinone/menaquinone biosynthesis C-methylase UbiE